MIKNSVRSNYYTWIMIVIIACIALFANNMFISRAGSSSVFDPLKPNTIALSFTGDPRTAIMISWETGTQISQGTIKVNQSNAGLSEENITTESKIISTTSGNRYLHRAHIQGLKPGTAYHYQLGNGQQFWEEIYTFTTEKAMSFSKEKDASFSFVHITDTHAQTSPAGSTVIWSNVMTQSVKNVSDLKFFIHTGDIVENNNNEDEMQAFFHVSQHILSSYPMMAAVGNHEETSAVSPDSYLQHFSNPGNGSEAIGVTPKTTYSFNYGNTHFIALNSECNTSAQVSWLTNDLIQANKDPEIKWKIIYFHNSPYGAGKSSSSAWPPVFAAYGVDLALIGHNHVYVRTKMIDAKGNEKETGGGIVYLMSNSSGTKYNSPKGIQPWQVIESQPYMPMFSAITVNDSSIDVKAYTINLQTVSILDAFSITKNGVVNSIPSDTSTPAPSPLISPSPTPSSTQTAIPAKIRVTVSGKPIKFTVDPKLRSGQVTVQAKQIVKGLKGQYRYNAKSKQITIIKKVRNKQVRLILKINSRTAKNANKKFKLSISPYMVNKNIIMLCPKDIYKKLGYTKYNFNQKSNVLKIS